MSTEDMVRRRVREIRKARGWTQPQLAERVNALTGWTWHQSTVAKCEGVGQKVPRRIAVDDLVALAIALEVSPATLMDGSPVTFEVQV